MAKQFHCLSAAEVDFQQRYNFFARIEFVIQALIQEKVYKGLFRTRKDSAPRSNKTSGPSVLLTPGNLESPGRGVGSPGRGIVNPADLDAADGLADISLVADCPGAAL